MSGLQAARRATARPNDSKRSANLVSILKEGQGRRPEGFSPEGRAPVPTVSSHNMPVGRGARLQRPRGAGASRSAGGRRRGAANRARQREEGGCVRGLGGCVRGLGGCAQWVPPLAGCVSLSI